MDTAELVDLAFALYRQNFILFTAIAGLIYVPFTIFSVFAGHTADNVPEWARNGSAGAASGAGAEFVSLLLFALSAVLVQAVLTVAVSDKYLGLPVTLATAYRETLRNGLALLATFTLLVMAVLAGSCACLLPGMVAAIGLAFAPLVVVLEKLPPTKALTRAWHLSRGDRLRLLGSLFLVTVALASIWATSSVLAHLVFRSALAIDLFVQLTTRLTLPLAHIAVVLFYFDNRIRKEGFDLALMAARLATRPPDEPVPAQAGEYWAGGATEEPPSSGPPSAHG
jgi:hypothetical protein